MSLLQKWNPFGTTRMEGMQERLRGAFGLSPLRRSNENISVSDWAPIVDVSEGDKEYLIKAELPEVKREDVNVSVDHGVLTISGERKSGHEEKTKKRHRIERSYGRFERSFVLPDEVDGTRVSADFKEGVLNVHLPKSPNAKPKSIDINAS